MGTHFLYNDYFHISYGCIFRLLKKSLFNELNYFAVRVFAFKILFLLADVFFTKLIEDDTVL